MANTKNRVIANNTENNGENNNQDANPPPPPLLTWIIVTAPHVGRVDEDGVEVVYHTFLRNTTRAICGGLLMEGLSVSTLKQDEHGGLRGSSHRSVIPYVYEKDWYIVVYVH
jgi:hypothetical protein